MDRWSNRVALVTGSNSGIGAEVCRQMIKHGMRVVGADMAKNHMEEMIVELKGEKGSLSPFICNLTKDEDVESLFKFIATNFKAVDVVVNTAGTADTSKLLDGTPKSWRMMTDINMISVCYISKLAIELMKKNKIDDGQIVNISSVAGHKLNPLLPFYSSTKFAVRAISEAIRVELREMKSNIRVSIICPGLVQSRLYHSANCSDDFIDNLYSRFVPIVPADIANTLIHILATPAHCSINEVIVSPTQQPFGAI